MSLILTCRLDRRARLFLPTVIVFQKGPYPEDLYDYYKQSNLLLLLDFGGLRLQVEGSNQGEAISS